MNRFFFHKEVILKRGYLATNFIVVLEGRALILNSSGNHIKREIIQNQAYGLVDTIKENKWKNTVVSENKCQVLFIPREILLKNIFSNKTNTSLTLNILKMAS